jgi:hypothetical protein
MLKHTDSGTAPHNANSVVVFAVDVDTAPDDGICKAAVTTLEAR